MQIINVFLTAAVATAAMARTGKMTYYDPSVGLGACGKVYQKSDHIVAISHNLWTAANPNKDPLCKNSIKITHGGKSITAKVTDQCPSCDTNHIDVSPSVFQHFGSLDVGTMTVSWDFN
jgi:hypothetical protein